MRKWKDLLINNMLDMVTHASNKGSAELLIRAYKDKQGLVRIKFIKRPEEIEETYFTEIED